jgi:hypothetical protein
VLDVRTDESDLPLFSLPQRRHFSLVRSAFTVWVLFVSSSDPTECVEFPAINSVVQFKILKLTVALLSSLEVKTYLTLLLPSFCSDSEHKLIAKQKLLFEAPT